MRGSLEEEAEDFEKHIKFLERRYGRRKSSRVCKSAAAAAATLRKAATAAAVLEVQKSCDALDKSQEEGGEGEEAEGANKSGRKWSDLAKAASMPNMAEEEYESAGKSEVCLSHVIGFASCLRAENNRKGAGTIQFRGQVGS